MCKFILTLELPVGVFISSAVYQCLEMTVVIFYIFSHATFSIFMYNAWKNTVARNKSWYSVCLLVCCSLQLTLKITLVQWDHPAKRLETIFLSEMTFIPTKHIHMSFWSISFVFGHCMYCPKATDMIDNIEIIYLFTPVYSILHALLIFNILEKG